MKMESREYFEQRERAERAAAKNASCPEARRIHQELAQHYAEMAQQFADAGIPRERRSIVTGRDPA
jgi:pyridoxine/pyridoxamine 5'-phosphate oxidase